MKLAHLALAPRQPATEVERGQLHGGAARERLVQQLRYCPVAALHPVCILVAELQILIHIKHADPAGEAAPVSEKVVHRRPLHTNPLAAMQPRVWPVHKGDNAAAHITLQDGPRAVGAVVVEQVKVLHPQQPAAVSAQECVSGRCGALQADAGLGVQELSSSQGFKQVEQVQKVSRSD